ncbi:uncharacterized protein LOC124135210 [Haliotis rufescens]|uniref:uncharacterized protein LOC124135210 n=1 Tax=Haliotis rufescens TaxID=6454 RepID=UPI00201EFA70|nr:uncharacterized protein LOC124135210 [Haliotis rufescens]
MRGSRELNNMRDTPSFKIKKVLVLSKLRHSSVSGRKIGGTGSASTSSKTTKKETRTKVKDDSKDQTVGLKRKGRPPKPKKRLKDEADTTQDKDGETGHGSTVKDSSQSGKKEANPDSELSKSVNTQPSSSGSKRQFGKKRSQLIAKPERKLRSQIGEMLMRHGKKVSKAPKPKRKRTLSADFELLDEKSLKRQLKENNDTASGAETDQNDSDASILQDSDNEVANTGKRRKKFSVTSTSSKSQARETSVSMDSSWADCPSPLIGSGKKLVKKSKASGNSRDSSVDESETSIVIKRQGTKQRTIRKQTDNALPDSSTSVSVASGDQQDDEKPKKRGRPPKRKRLVSQDSQVSESGEIEENIERQPQLTKVDANAITEIKMSKETVKKQRIVRNEECQTDPYTFSGLDFEEEDDSEISFKPTGMSGDVKRKPGRPKIGVSRQPIVKSLKVKNTHKLLISDQKHRPFSRVRGGRILKASQMYKTTRKRTIQQCQDKPSVLLEAKKVIDEESAGRETDLVVQVEERKPPVITPLRIVVSEQESGTGSPLSPEMQHPDLTIIKDLISPAPSNEDLEPPVLELATFEAGVMAEEQDVVGDSVTSDIDTVIEEVCPEEGVLDSLESMDGDVMVCQEEVIPFVAINEVPDTVPVPVVESSDMNNEATQMTQRSSVTLPNEETKDIKTESSETAEDVEAVQSEGEVLPYKDKADGIESEIHETCKEAEPQKISEAQKVSEPQKVSECVTQPCQPDVDNVDKMEIDNSEPVQLVSSKEEEKSTNIEEVSDETIRACLQAVVDDIVNTQSQDSEKCDESEVIKSDTDIGSNDQMDAISDVESKDKEHKCEPGGIKMKLKRHKGKFKVTRLSEEDDSLIADVALEDGIPNVESNFNEKCEEDSKVDVIALVMEHILDTVECNLDGSKVTEDKVSDKQFEKENDVFTETNEVEDASFSSSSDISPVDSEKRVPPLTIRLKSGKPGRKPVRKFELRPKISRSPIEIIAMRQKRIEEEYDKNEATRLARKIEKQIGKRKNLAKSAFKESNIAEVGITNVQKAGNFEELMELCTPCSVKLVDFVKQLNLTNQSEDESQSNSQQSDLGVTGGMELSADISSPPAPATVKKKRMMKGRKSQFKSGRPRGRPPKNKNKDGLTVAQLLKLKQDDTPTPELPTTEKNVEELDGEGFVGSFVEFLKSKKKEKPKSKVTDASKTSKKTDTKADESITKVTPVAVPPPATVAPVVNAHTVPESVRLKHLSGDRKSGVKYVCNKCEFSSAVQKTMEFHVYSHIPGLSFKCGHCNKIFASMVGASAHSKNEHHGKESKVIKSKDLIESELYHVIEEAPKVPVETNVLKPVDPGSVSGSTASGPVIISFLVDSKSLKSPNAKRFMCTHCDYSTDILEDVQQHAKDLHSVENLYACILCADAYFNSEETVMSHNQTTHPSRPQSYRKLPNFYDVEQMKVAEKSQLEDRGNIFDRMNNLFSTTNVGDDSNSENPRKAHYQRARDFLYVQEGWKNKTSAEADSTTTVENETVSNTVDSDSVCNLGDNQPVTVESETKGATSVEKQAAEKLNKAASDKTDSMCVETEQSKKESGNEKANILEPKASSTNNKAASEGDGKSLSDSSSVNDAVPSMEKEKATLDQENTGAEKGAMVTDINDDTGHDDSGVSSLKIVDVVSLRDQNPEPAVEPPRKRMPTRNTSQTSRGANNLPEVDVDALVLRNERITCTYKCMKCNIHSPYLSAMVEHLKNYHSEIALFTCPYCKGFNSQKPEFTTEVNVHEHVKKVHPSNCAKNEVSLSDTAKTFVQVLAIPSGVECNKVGNTFVIEKDIYMCLKCQAHMPSLDYTFGHLEREHPDAFVQVCPLCKTFKDKSDEVVFAHIMKEHNQDPNDHPLSVAIEDDLFLRIPSISKSGAYNDKVNTNKGAKLDTNRKIAPKPSIGVVNDESEDDVLVVGESRNPSRPSAIRSTGQSSKRGRPPLISQGVGGITTAPRLALRPPRFSTPIQPAHSQPKGIMVANTRFSTPVGTSTRFSPPKAKSSTKSSPEQAQELMMDCESVDDPVNANANIVEEDGDVVVPAVPTTAISSPASLIDSSNVISHSAAVAVASSVVSVDTTVRVSTATTASVTQTTTAPVTANKQIVVNTAPPPPPPLKRFGVPILPKTTASQQAEGHIAKTHISSTPTQQTTSISLADRPLVAEKIKELQICRPKSSLFSMTDKLHRLHMRAAEREREKEKAAQLERNSPLNAQSSPLNPRSSPQFSREALLSSRSSPITSRSSPMLNTSQPSLFASRPVLKVPSYSSMPRPQPPPRPSSAAPMISSVNANIQHSQSQAAQAHRKSLLFRNCPLDLSRTPSPAPTQMSSTPPQSKTVSDDLPPDAFKIFNLKPDSRRQKPCPQSTSNTSVRPPVKQVLGNTIPNIVGTLAAPGTLLQQVQALPYTQLAQMQMAGVPLNPLQLQGLCIPGINTGSSFVLAHLPQHQGTRLSVPPQQLPQMHSQTPVNTSSLSVPVSQPPRPSSAKTVAQALAERSHGSRHAVPIASHPRPKQSIPARSVLSMKKTGHSRISQQGFCCPYCPQFRPLQDFEVTPHIERCHPGKDVMFVKVP